MRIRRFVLTGLALCGLVVLTACTQNKSFVTHQVDIASCSATPTQVDLDNLEYVHWTSKDVDYEIDFSSDDPTASPFKVHGNSDKNRQIKGHQKCIHNYSTNGCWYKYTITKVGDNKPCSDPIIHIVPNQ